MRAAPNARSAPARSTRVVDARARRLSSRRAARVHASSSASSKSKSNDPKHLYNLLGVSSTATAKEIKSAYRKRALELHPDVNKSPDASTRFNEVKEAYNVLIDPKLRAAYDDAASSTSRGPSASDWTDAWSRATSGSRASSASTGARRSQQPEEEFYGFKDFFADLEKELAAREAKRPAGAAPKSLWEELYDIGEEFVDFLETSAPKPSKKPPDDAFRYDGSARAPPKPKPPPSSSRSASARSAKDTTVDDMLADLKRDMGL
jgi:curved DNA-binding protein CbpA